MAERDAIHVAAAEGGWPHPWPNVAELAHKLPGHYWTLVGGLMTQLHTIHHGLGVVRPTNDVDIVLHIETSRGVPAKAATALEALGYRLQENIDPRNNTAHRWARDGQVVDVGGASVEDGESGDEPNDELDGRQDVDANLDADADLDVDPSGGVVLRKSAGRDSRDDRAQHGSAPSTHVDVLAADHPAPTVIERMRGRDMVPIEGGTQALRRTINAHLTITDGLTSVISVPRPFGAVILKAAAYLTDSRDKDRHLYDAAALLACIEDPFSEAEALAGSDRQRLRVLVEKLPDSHPAWSPLAPRAGEDARAALRILGEA